MRRRACLIAPAAVLLGAGPLAALPVPAGGELAFEIWRKQRQIGTHVLKFARQGDALTVTIAVRIALYFGPIRLFHYRMDGVEQWAEGRFFHIETVTDDDGKTDHMSAQRRGDDVTVEGSGTSPYTAPPHALPATHWNIAELDGPWINPQTGALFHPHVTPLGEEPVPVAGGATVPGQHYRVSGDIALDLWYDSNQCWLSLAFAGKDGSQIRYLRRPA